MQLKEVASAINEDRLITYGKGTYIVVGYKLLKRQGVKEYSVGLIDTNNMRTLLWVKLSDI